MSHLISPILPFTPHHVMPQLLASTEAGQGLTKTGTASFKRQGSIFKGF